MSRFYVPKETIKGNKIIIVGKEAHHILDVMRLKFSDEVIVFDGTGKEYIGKVTKVSRRSVFVEIRKVRDAAHKEKYSITLIQAIPKKEKMDYIVEKATELGVSIIIPVTTDRTIPAWNDSKKVFIVERWKKIAQEASKQCGRVDIPEVTPIMDFKDAVTAAVGAAKNGYNTAAVYIIAALSDKTVKLKDALKSCPAGMIAIAIGPEGDFTLEELNYAQDYGFKTVNLGLRVLKSDTAALAVLAVINYEFL